ncbi:phage tail tape measure protein [Clostridium sp. YIM B02551]|uniref:phage tail tape measure protein n=1 Tax=Clostridium sp. YIM B02551 TaxID=2910679 RepID=UPI001EE9BEF5|nr:phage tail tape measure protein [Clostridium sp. YIM B02551]
MGTDLGSIYSSLDLRLNKFESSISKAIQGFYSLQTGVEKSSYFMDQSIFTAVSNIDKSYRIWELSSNRTGKELLDNSNKIDSLKAQIKLLDDEIVKSEKTMQTIEKQCGNNSKEAEEYKSHLLDLKLSHAELSKELDNTAKQTTTLSGKLDLLGKAYDSIDEKVSGLKRIGQTASDLGSKLTMGVTLPIVGAATAAEKFAMDFESGMAKVSTIADTTKVPIDELKQGVVNLSNETGTSTKDLNDALYETLSAGVDTAKSVGFLNVAIKAAKGGFTDTATAVDGLTTVLNSYGLTADKTNDIANQMLITQNLGKTTFGELAGAIGKVTPIAAALGITTNELFSSLASTTAQGLDTSESVTALKASMSNIVKPTKEASDAAEMLGIDFSVSAVKSKGWIGFLSDVKEKLKQASPEFANVSNQVTINASKMLELEKAGKKNTEEYKNLSKANKNLTTDLEALAKMSDSPLSAFAQMFGSVEGLNSILMLTSENGMQLYNESMRQMKDNTGALDDAYNKMSETTETKFSKALNKAKNSLMELGVKALPVVDKGIDLLSGLLDKFDSLSPSTQEWIIKIGLASAALGPLLSLTGGAINTFANLLTLGPKISTFFGLFKGASTVATAVEGIGTAATVAEGTAAGGGILGLASSFGGAALAFAPWLAGAAAVGVAGYSIYKSLNEEIIPSVDLFADKVEYTATSTQEAYNSMGMATETTVTKISDGTKKAVGSYIELDNQAKEKMQDLYINSTGISEDIKNEMTAKFNQMATQVIQGYEKQRIESIKSLQNMFSQQNELTSTEQADILAKTNQYYTDKQTQTQNYESQINTIMANASSQKRQLTADETSEITKLQNEMRANAVNALSQNEIEAQTILQRMKDYDGRITSEQASEHIKQLNESRDKAIQAANDEYNQRISAITRLRDEAHSITGQQADEMIAEAQRQKDGVVSNAQQTRDNAVSTIFGMNEDLKGNVDSTTGEIMKWYQRISYWLSTPETKTITVNTYYKPHGNATGTDKMSGPAMYASGTNNFEGGLTTLHERGYEVYDLPQGTRIYNHQASEDMVMKTAKEVARSVLQNINTPNGGDIIIPISIAGEEIDRIIVPRVSNKLATNILRRR